MTRSVTQARSSLRRRLASEKGTIHKDWGGRLPIALIFPNCYRVAMSNLGFQTLYALLNAEPDIVCERLTWEGPASPPLSIESQRHLSEFPVWGFSVPFELDYFHLVRLIHQAGVPLWADEREDGDPFLLGGGIALSANPEPVAPFLDAVIVGESEPVLGPLLEALRGGKGQPRGEILASLGQIDGIYVPSLHDGEPIERQWARDISTFATTSVILTRETEFGDAYLIEIARGCCWRCRFCLAGHFTRPPRFRRMEQLRPQIVEGLRYRRRIGLVGAAVSDHPDLEEIAQAIRELDGGFTVASLRADQLSPIVLAGLQESGTKTLTLAPEVGSARMAQVINKGFGELELLQGVAMARQAGLHRIKLYFMVGLPQESDADIRAIVDLVEKVQDQLQGGTIRLSVAPFVPKAHTPFQRVSMASAAVQQKRIRFLKRELQPQRVSVQGGSAAWSQVQGVLARGDQRLAPVLASMTGLSLGHWRKALAKAKVHPEEYLRRREPDEPLPWDFIVPGT